jgi:uncharacterized membrane protein
MFCGLLAAALAAPIISWMMLLYLSRTSTSSRVGNYLDLFGSVVLMSFMSFLAAVIASVLPMTFITTVGYAALLRINHRSICSFICIGCCCSLVFFGTGIILHSATAADAALNFFFTLPVPIAGSWIFAREMRAFDAARGDVW